MNTTEKSISMDDILAAVSRTADGSSMNAAFAFLYKEILVNRMMIMESADTPNRAAVEHNEKMINELNQRLMEHFR